MFGWKSKMKGGENGAGWTDKAATTIAGIGLGFQRKFARVMNGLFSRMPIKKLKIAVVLFCLIGGGYSIYLVTHALVGHHKRAPALWIEPVQVPEHFDQSESEVPLSKQYVTEEMFREIQGYKKYKDSIGQPIRPGLLDSIGILEEMYHSQNIK